MIYITGASGFIGKNLTKKIGEFVAIPHEDIIATDWTKATKIFFLSAYGNMASHEDPNKILRANVIDLCFVLSSVDWSKIESFVFVSTSSVKLKRQTMYSRTKRAAEELMLAYMELYDAPITVIRPLSVTGVGEQKDHLIPKLIESSFTGKEMLFVPEPVHDFIDVEDLTDGIVSLSNTGAKGIFELGNGVPITNQQVLDLVTKEVAKVGGKPPSIMKVKEMRDYDTDKWVCENFKARGWGWLPKKSLELSIKEMVNEFRQNISN